MSKTFFCCIFFISFITIIKKRTECIMHEVKQEMQWGFQFVINQTEVKLHLVTMFFLFLFSSIKSSGLMFNTKLLQKKKIKMIHNSANKRTNKNQRKFIIYKYGKRSIHLNTSSNYLLNNVLVLKTYFILWNIKGRNKNVNLPKKLTIFIFTTAIRYFFQHFFLIPRGFPEFQWRISNFLIFPRSPYSSLAKQLILLRINNAGLKFDKSPSSRSKSSRFT